MENTITLTLTEAQHKNLIVFLNRVNLTGAEAVPYVELMTTLMTKPKEK